MLYYELPISIGNFGNVTLENINLSFEFAQESPLPIEDKWVEETSTMPEGFTARKYTKLDRKVKITENIKYINPKIRFDTAEMIRLNETKLDFKNKSIDGKIVNVKMSFSHKVKLSLDAKNVNGQNFVFNIKLIDYKKEKDFTDHLNEIYEKLGPFEKYEYCLNKKIFVINPEITKIDSKDGTTLFCGKVFPENIKYLDLSNNLRDASKKN